MNCNCLYAESALFHDICHYAIYNAAFYGEQFLLHAARALSVTNKETEVSQTG